ncbi:MAG: hypothetical protein QG597_1040, partial [Actinomycetota bacterium]|nr:hypothetical protein [Actinomycetota bacterium]
MPSGFHEIENDLTWIHRRNPCVYGVVND